MQSKEPKESVEVVIESEEESVIESEEVVMHPKEPSTFLLSPSFSRKKRKRLKRLSLIQRVRRRYLGEVWLQRGKNTRRNAMRNAWVKKQQKRLLTS